MPDKPPTETIILTAFNGYLKSAPHEWERPTPPVIYVSVNTSITNWFDERIPDDEVTYRKAVFEYIGEYQDGCKVYELKNVRLI